MLIGKEDCLNLDRVLILEGLAIEVINIISALVVAP